MDLTKVLAQLRGELANLDAAIVSLERLQQESPRRGRPPKGVAAAKRLHAEEELPPASGEKLS